MDLLAFVILIQMFESVLTTLAQEDEAASSGHDNQQGVGSDIHDNAGGIDRGLVVGDGNSIVAVFNAGDSGSLIALFTHRSTIPRSLVIIVEVSRSHGIVALGSFGDFNLGSFRDAGHHNALTIADTGVSLNIDGGNTIDEISRSLNLVAINRILNLRRVSVRGRASSSTMSGSVIVIVKPK